MSKQAVRSEKREVKASAPVPVWSAGEIISAGTGKLCCPVERLYAIMNHLTGADLFTHQLPKAFKDCQQWVLKQHPWLLELDEAACTKETWKEWLADAVARFGDAHRLDPMPGGVEQADPIDELVEMVGRERVLVV